MGICDNTVKTYLIFSGVSVRFANTENQQPATRRSQQLKFCAKHEQLLSVDRVVFYMSTVFLVCNVFDLICNECHPLNTFFGSLLCGTNGFALFNVIEPQISCNQDIFQNLKMKSNRPPTVQRIRKFLPFRWKSSFHFISNSCFSLAEDSLSARLPQWFVPHGQET